jgi:hypothetical protein
MTQTTYATTPLYVRHEISSTKNSNNNNNNNNKHCVQFGTGRKIKKPFMPVKNATNHLTLKNETEDTCDDDDFFSTHVQKNNLTK